MDEVDAAPQVPGYTLGQRLGAGGAGSVWQAIRDRDHANVAIKVVAGDRPDDLRDGVGADKREDHLVHVHDVVPLAHARTAIVMDLMSGGSLRSVVAARGRLSPGECVTVLTPLAGLLGRLHRRGIVHGDISPDNVLFDLRGRPHLTDLGASHAVGDAPRDVLGTDGFIAPEVLLGDDPRAASDVFGLAALGWFCLLGTEPDLAQVRGTLADELARHDDPGDRADLDLIPPSLVTCLDSALTGNAPARPDADAFAVAVFDSAEAEPLQITKGADVTSGLTRRLRSAVHGAARTPRTEDSVRPSRHVREGGARRQRHLARGVGILLTLAFVSLAVLAVALLLRPSAPASAATQAVARPPMASSAATPGKAATPGPSAAERLTREVRTPSAEQLVDLVQDLSASRARAWGDVDSAEWTDLSAPGSPAAAADMADREALRASGERPQGLALTVLDAAWAGGAPEWTAEATPTAMTVRATVGVSAHLMVSDTGSRSVPEDPNPAPIEFDLRWVDGAWRVWSLAR